MAMLECCLGCFAIVQFFMWIRCLPITLGRVFPWKEQVIRPFLASIDDDVGMTFGRHYQRELQSWQAGIGHIAWQQAHVRCAFSTTQNVLNRQLDLHMDDLIGKTGCHA